MCEINELLTSLVIPYVESSNVEWYEQRLKEGRIFQYDYSKFIIRKQIGKGGFGTVYSADYGVQKLALKRFTSKNTIRDFAREVKRIYKVSIHDNINRFHGITYETVDQFIINEKYSPASTPFSETSTGPSEYFTLVTIDSSNIITRKHAEMIYSCIDGNKFPCKFRLLYRASRDGLKLKDFHKLCDDKEGTVVVLKVNQTEILGGYNPMIWQKAPRKFGIPVNSSVETENLKSRKDKRIRRAIFHQTILFTIDIAQLLTIMVYRELGRFIYQLPSNIFAELFSTAFTIFVMTKFLDKFPELFKANSNIVIGNLGVDNRNLNHQPQTNIDEGELSNQPRTNIDEGELNRQPQVNVEISSEHD
ncbi:27049_t:CDS:2 [Gigaspora margarita]|uniref:27049_t:CDS:1 n=1 Tax=Gigaspora margarita TaxID=4874 RepID=A0ABN7UQM3_GIGMA|nr:27049_t:CDS:2 [Gigaspora margarita]